MRADPFVMEAVAERDHRARRKTRRTPAIRAEALRGIVGRQQHAPPGKARALLQVQIGDDEDALLRPDSAPRQSRATVTLVMVTSAVAAWPLGSDWARGAEFPFTASLPGSHCIASFTSSASAAASSCSDASP